MAPRGSVEVDTSPFCELEETIRSLWLDFTRIRLGTIELGTLKGTLAKKSPKTWTTLFRPPFGD